MIAATVSQSATPSPRHQPAQRVAARDSGEVGNSLASLTFDLFVVRCFSANTAK
jgi:hypothetical protein